MVQYEPVQHDVEGSLTEVQPAGVADVRLVSPPRGQHAVDALGLGVDADEPERGRWEQVPPGMPTASDGQHLSAGEAQPAIEQQTLALHDVRVVTLERRAAAQPVEQVAGLVGFRARGRVWCGPCQHRRVRFEEVAARIEGIPFMSPALGRRVYDHIAEASPERVLELGTAHGVSAAYMAAALEANDAGHVTTVDHGGASYDPSPEDVLAGAGLEHRVTIVREHSSYNWFLKREVERASDDAGNCVPVYDFCYLDGAKNFNVDGLAVVLIEKLLRPGGWLLMDDLEWTYEHNPWIVPSGDGNPLGPLSESERTEPHLRAAFELIAKQPPSFTRLQREDEWYGWAQKLPGGERRYELSSSRPLSAVLMGELRRRRHRAARRV